MKKWGTKSSFVLQTWKKLITERDVCVFLLLCPSIDTSLTHTENTPPQTGHVDLFLPLRHFSICKYSLQHLDLGLGGADGRGLCLGTRGWWAGGGAHTCCTHQPTGIIMGPSMRPPRLVKWVFLSVLEALVVVVLQESVVCSVCAVLWFVEWVCADQRAGGSCGFTDSI